MTEVWAVLPAGGQGNRFSATQDKLLADLAGLPVLLRTLQAFLDAPSITGLLVVASEPNLPIYQTLVQRHLPTACVQWALGGSTRRDSVYQGLCGLPPSAEIVVIHDAARPLIRPDLIEKAIQSLLNGNPVGVIVGLPMVDTV